MAPAFHPSSIRALARRIPPAARRVLVLVIAAGLMSVLSGAGAVSAGSIAPSPALAPELEQLAQLPTDPPPDPGDDSDTLGVTPTAPAQQQAPDTTAIQATPVPSAAAADTTGASGAVPPGASATPSDSTGAVLHTAPQTAAPDTLFMNSPVLPAGPPTPRGTTATTGTQPQTMPGPKPEAKKPRTGILGIHPIAILVGLAAVHYLVIHAVD